MAELVRAKKHLGQHFLTDEKIAELEAQYSIKTSLEVWHNLIEEAKTLA